MSKTHNEIKYSSPKILLLDTAPDVEEALARKGFDTKAGSFGFPTKVIDDDSFIRAMTNETIPFDWTDRWLIIVQLQPEHGEERTEWKPLPKEFSMAMLPDEYGIIDPRPIAMSLYREGFDRIVANGGIIICFANSQKTITLVDGPIKRPTRIATHDNWGFASFFRSKFLLVEQASGHDICLSQGTEKTPLACLLQRHLNGASFLCVLSLARGHPPAIEFKSLLEDKFRRPVGGILAPRNSEKAGLILILPQLHEKATFLTQLLTDVLPDCAPNLFPELVSGRWLTTPEYELPMVLGLRSDIDNIRQMALEQIDQIEDRINHERETWGYLHALLNGTGECLVHAVEKTFNLLGFTRTTNVDKEIAAGRENIRKREDLRIEKDSRPELVVEVRGLSNLPSDEDCFGAEKHVHPRSKEKQDFRVKGLTVINHERNIPPIDRQNDKVFRQDVVTNAVEREIGLLTTWNLYRLTRSFLKYGWKHEQIEYLLYQSGPIIPVPNHYAILGTIGRIFIREPDTIMGIEIAEGEIRTGDVIAVELDHEFEEQVVSSLKIRDQTVEEAGVGDQVGVLTDISLDRLKKGVRVFKVISSSVISQ